ncbi:fimbrial biogenesis chaperone [Enterobacter cloacae]|uniref:fimbrial biogenesis chaperone n=1 Tax=Enterobacter cloacae TaxID=550 RepID=UPI002B21E4DB|nr:molecular chaperone [Enterobacter cloacae]MEA5217577.1 molecular chaperone [Enterobacter cloacae]
MRTKTTCPPMRGRLPLAGILLGLLAGGVPGVQAALPGVGFSFSRVVLMATDKGGGSVKVRNNTDNVYLVQSQIHAADVNKGRPVEVAAGAAPAAFLVLPPLKRLEPHGELPLRILATPAAREQLPKDRESVFFVSSKSIPSVPPSSDEKAASGGRVVLALVNSIKLYWRPDGLQKEAVAAMAGSLTFRREGSTLRVSNPSAYYVTFSSLTVGGVALAGDDLQAMVPPKGEQTYPWPAKAAGRDVRWQLIDEYGLTTDEQRGAVP